MPPMDRADEQPEVSIVMPCLNEAETLETCIRKAPAVPLIALGGRDDVVGA